jgi:hypothetical protein
MLIHKALLKYGYSNFTLEILEYCSKDKIIDREQYFLDKFKPEYNILQKAGSSLGFKHKLETIKKLREIQLKIHESKEHFEKKIKANPNSKKINLINVETNKVFSFDSMRDAARKLQTEFSYSEGFIRASLSKCLKHNILIKNKYKVVSR